MKETLFARIGGEAFTLDTDAYEALKGYFDDIRSRLEESPDETMEEIEGRVGELLREMLPSPMQVVTIDTARRVMARMGAPADFGERHGAREPSEGGEPVPRKLRRSRTDRSIAGICAGIARFFDADVTLVRLVTLLLVLFGGMSLWVYVILWIVIPKEEPDTETQYTNDKKR